MKIEGKYKCEHCGKCIEWFHQVPQKYGSYSLDVETIPKGKAGLYQVTRSVEKDGYKMPLEATAYCPECGRINNIKIEDKVK